MMLERNAKLRICPLTRDEDNEALRNRCIASECMMWRWNIQSLSFRQITFEDDSFEVEEEHGEHGGGYCGLAGRLYTDLGAKK